MLSCGSRIGAIRSAVLVIVGEADGVVPARVAELVRRKAKNAASFESVVLPGAGHLFPFDERAQETARLVVDFIKRR
jgi:pimeloyl-ACP methyl ester carboxylesterase